VKRWIIACVILALAAGCAAAVYMRSGVASVNGQKIAVSQFYEALQDESGEQVLDRLILELLVKQEAGRRGITVSADEVAEEIAQIKAQFPSEQEFANALQDAGMSMAELEDRVRLNELLRKLALKDVKITEEDIQKYFEENKESLAEPPRARIRHILVGTREEAAAILGRIKAGEDFGNLAVALSTDEATRSIGGDLGFVTPGQMEEEFDRAAFALKPGEVSDVVETPDGFHLIKVEAREEGKPATLDGSRRKIIEALEDERAKPVDQVLEELRAASNIKVFWERYKSLEHSPEKTESKE
jgi:foldase protein PrsA